MKGKSNTLLILGMLTVGLLIVMIVLIINLETSSEQENIKREEGIEVTDIWENGIRMIKE